MERLEIIHTLYAEIICNVIYAVIRESRQNSLGIASKLAFSTFALLHVCDRSGGRCRLVNHSCRKWRTHVTPGSVTAGLLGYPEMMKDGYFSVDAFPSIHHADTSYSFSCIYSITQTVIESDPNVFVHHSIYRIYGKLPLVVLFCVVFFLLKLIM